MAKDGIGDLIGNPAIYLGLGIAGLFFGFFFLLIGALVGSSTGFGSMFYVCGIIGLIPGFIFIAMVFKMKKKDEDLESLGEILQAYRRIKMSLFQQHPQTNGSCKPSLFREGIFPHHG